MAVDAKYDRKTMQDSFRQLTEQAEKIREQSAPLREARDKFANEAREKELEMNAQIKEVEKELADIDNTRGMLSRALGGQTG